MIITFYSFKGGVGRSMALANIARSFQLNGLNVVMVDWDLEAPGLETFFTQDAATLSGWRSRVGLIDLLELYRQDFGAIPFGASTRDTSAQPEPPNSIRHVEEDAAKLRDLLPPLRFSLIDVPPATIDTNDGRPLGKLRLLTAGWREGARFSSYANAVQSFDWNDFYVSYRGYAYFEWLRSSLTDPDLADVVLIDSRTGVTEMGGVCTRQLADVVVTLTAPNRQNVDGATQMAASFSRPDLLEQRNNRPILSVIVPSRVDVSATDVKQIFEDDFQTKANVFLPDSLRRLDVDFLDLRIPYVSKFGFQERLSVGESDGDRDLNRAYALLAAHIAWLAPEGDRLKTLMSAEFVRLFGQERIRNAQDFGAQFESRWMSINVEGQQGVRELLLRLVEVRSSASDVDRSRPFAEAVCREAFPRASEAAIAAGLVTVRESAQGTRGTARESSQGSRVMELSEPEYVTRSERFASWIDEDRSFLVWRQRLRVFLEDWRLKGSDHSSLLQGSALVEAVEMLDAASPDDLLADEREFIETSRTVSLAPQTAPPVAAPPHLGRAPELTATQNFPAHHGEKPVVVTRNNQFSMRMVAAAVMLGIVALVTVYSFATKTQSPVGAMPTSGASIDSLLLAGRLAVADTQYANAIDAYTLALQLNPQSVEARRLRGEANELFKRPREALADFDTALTLAPNSAGLHSRRAQSRWAAGDTIGALADFATVPVDSLDVPALRAKADALRLHGSDTAALAAYNELIKRGDTSTAQVGRGQVFERLGKKTEAIAAYSAAAGGADESIRTFSQGRLKVLNVNTPLARPVTHLVYLQFTISADKPLADSIDAGLRTIGLHLEQERGLKYELTPNAKTSGEIRYFVPGNEILARKVQTAVEGALAVTAGTFQRLSVLYVPAAPDAKHRQNIEIWLPGAQRDIYKKN